MYLIILTTDSSIARVGPWLPGDYPPFFTVSRFFPNLGATSTHMPSSLTLNLPMSTQCSNLLPAVRHPYNMTQPFSSARLSKMFHVCTLIKWVELTFFTSLLEEWTTKSSNESRDVGTIHQNKLRFYKA